MKRAEEESSPSNDHENGKFQKMLSHKQKIAIILMCV